MTESASSWGPFEFALSLFGIEPLVAAMTAWLVFILLKALCLKELSYWLSAEEALRILDRSTGWRIAGFCIAGAEVFLLASLQDQWPSLYSSMAIGGFSGALLLAAMIDLRSRLLPDRITWLLIGTGLAVAAMGLSVSLGQAIAGGIIGYTLPWALALITQKKNRVRSGDELPVMGRGDFALIAAIGIWLGFSHLPLVLVVSGLCMLPVMAWGLLRKGWSLKTALPFGPALCGAGVALLPWTGFGAL